MMKQNTPDYKEQNQKIKSITLPKQDDEAHLLYLLSKGDKQAFDMLYDKYWHYVYNEVQRRISNLKLVKDITQDVFVQLWIQGNKSAIENLSEYLWATTRSSVLKFIEVNGSYTDLRDIADLPNAKFL